MADDLAGCPVTTVTLDLDHDDVRADENLDFAVVRSPSRGRARRSSSDKPDGTCIQIAAAGARSVTKSFDVMAGSGPGLSQSGRPPRPGSFPAPACAAKPAG